MWLCGPMPMEEYSTTGICYCDGICLQWNIPAMEYSMVIYNRIFHNWNILCDGDVSWNIRKILACGDISASGISVEYSINIPSIRKYRWNIPDVEYSILSRFQSKAANIPALGSSHGIMLILYVSGGVHLPLTWQVLDTWSKGVIQCRNFRANVMEYSKSGIFRLLRFQ